MSTSEFERAQGRLLERVGVKAESRFVKLPTASGRAHVLVCGEGPPLVLPPHAADVIVEAGHAPWLAHPERVAPLATPFLRGVSG